MGCLSGKHPAQEEREGQGPQVQEKEDTESIYSWRSAFKALWTLQRLLGGRGLCQMHQLPG